MRSWLPALIVPAVVITTASLAAQAAAEPPVISPTQELVLGERAVDQFLAKHTVTADAELAARVDEIGRRLAAVSDRPDVLHRTIVVAGENLQAWAFLGGAVVVTERLGRTLDEAELAFALAHEMAHVDLRHQPNRVLVEDVVHDAAGRSASADSALSVHDRYAELEADRFGALYMVRAGFPFSAVTSTLRKLQSTGGLDEDDKHPDYSERIRVLEKFEVELRRTIEAFDRGFAALKEGHPSDAVQNFTLFVANFPQSLAGRVNLASAYLSRWRAGHGWVEGLVDELPILSDPGITIRSGFGEEDARNARTQFDAALKLDPDASTAQAGIALLLLRERQPAKAREHLSVAEKDPHLRPEVLLLYGNADYLESAWASAADRYENALAARAGWPAARVNLARALERSGDADASKAQWKFLLNDPVWGTEAHQHTSSRAPVAVH